MTLKKIYIYRTQTLKISSHPIDTPLCDSIHGAHVKEAYVPFHLVKTTVLFLLQVSMSLGSTALLALGLGLLDESVAPTKIPACIGVVIGSSLLGLQTGLMVGKFAFHVNAEFNLASDIVWLSKSRIYCAHYVTIYINSNSIALFV